MRVLSTSCRNPSCTYRLLSGWPGSGTCSPRYLCKSEIYSVTFSTTLHNAHLSNRGLLLGNKLVPLTSSVIKCGNKVDFSKYRYINFYSAHLETKGLHTCIQIPRTGYPDSGGVLDNTVYRNHTLLSRWKSRSTKSELDGEGKLDEDVDKFEHRKMLQTLSNENDMLSRFRNTYIMTLVSIALLQYEGSQLPSALAAIAIGTSALNLTYGTYVYISNLRVLRRNGKIAGSYFYSRAAFGLTHFVLWSLLFSLLFPDADVIDAELKRFSED